MIYFNSRGAAELTRYLLAALEIPYDNMRYPLQASASGFGVTADFVEHQQAGHFAVNMGQLPVLQILTPDGKAAVATLGQSHAMNRFLAKEHGLLGATSLEGARIDAFYEAVRDVRSSYLQSKKNGTKQKWLNEELPPLCEKLEGSLLPVPKPKDISTHPWLIGTTTSLADISLYSLLGTTTSLVSGSFISAFDGFDPLSSYETTCPRLTASVQAVAKLKGIQAWEERRPDTFS